MAQTLTEDDLNAISQKISDDIGLGGRGWDEALVAIANVISAEGPTVNLTANAISSVVAGIDSDPPAVNLTTVAVTAVTEAGVTITPAAGTVPDRAGTTAIVGYVQETNVISITIADSAGDPVDVSAKTLGVYFETEDNRTAVASVTSGITVSGTGNNVVNFAKPSAVSTLERRLIYAVRDQAAPKTVYVGGVLDVQYLPAGS